MSHYKIEIEIKHTLSKTIEVEGEMGDMDAAKEAVKKGIEYFAALGIPRDEIVVVRSVKVGE